MIKSRGELDDLAKWCRQGTIVELVHAFLLADPKRKRLAGGMRAEFRKAMTVLEKRGARVFDVTADVGSDKRKALLAVVDADISRSTRGRSSLANLENAKRGRKETEFTPDELREAKAVWRNVKDYPTWEDAAAAMPEGFTTARAFRLWKGRK